jgi:hypothetical protein
MEFATIFIAVLAIEYIWWVLSCRRNRRARKERMAASLKHWAESNRDSWTEADDK